MWSLLPLACTPENQVRQEDPGRQPASEAPETGTAVDTGGPYVTPDLGVDPLLSVEEVATGIEDAIAAVRFANPKDALDAEKYMIDNGDGCPIEYEDFYETYGYYYLYGPCSTDSGVAYDGYNYWYWYDPFWSGSYYYNAYAYYYGTSSMTLADGDVFDAGGYVYYYDYSYGSARGFYGYMYGSFAYSGGAFADSWLQAGLEASYSLSAYHDPASGGRQLAVSGTVGGFDGPANAAEFTSVFLFSQAFGSTCELEPSGSIAVRDEEGAWYDVAFDGPAFSGATVYPEDCDGCGDVWYQGERIGQACPDFSGFTAWTEEGPWT
jgi:hypothetical protein